MKTNHYKVFFITAVCFLLSMNAWSQKAITNVADLQKIGNDAGYPLTGDYYLTADIDLSSVAEWIPIGAISVTDVNPTPFSGVFDGKGFSITNLKITTSSDFKGLFGVLNNATVKNLTLEVDINAANHVGAVVGSMQDETSIERVAVKGSIKGLINVGGIVGRVQFETELPLHNRISNCYVNATVESGNIQAGGIAGRSNGTLIVEKVYVAGKIKAPQSAADKNAAGIVSYMDNNLIQFLASVVAVDEITGGTPNLFYSNYSTKRWLEYFEDIYARNDIALQYASEDKGPGAGIVSDEMLLAPERLKDRSFYTDVLLWDFDNVWIMGADGYPELRSTINPEVVREKQKIKVACIGNSITENAALTYYEKYPTRIQQLFGTDDYAVRNYGTGGTCMLKAANSSYWKLPRFTAAKNWAPDILVIKLGTNDTNDNNWGLIENYKSDYLDFIASFKEVNPDIEIYVCHPIPTFNLVGREERIKWAGQVVKEVAQETGATFVDLYTPFVGKSNYYYDNLHPGAEGTKIIANTLYTAISGNEIQQQVIYASPTGTGDGSSWAEAAGFSAAAQAARTIENHQIWLKEGTYTFTASENFDGLFIYGGFKGTEETLNERNWHENQTILDGNDQVSPLRNRTTTTNDLIPCLLDGVIVQNGKNPQAENGGAMITNNGTVLRNCIFRNNQTVNAKNGAAIHCHVGMTVIENCLFVNNTSDANGGAIQIGGNASCVLTNTTLANNKSKGLGGAIGVGANNSNCTLINTLAYNNSSSDGSAYNSYAQNANINNGGTIISIHSAIESESTKFSDGNDENHIKLTRMAPPGFSSASEITGKATTPSDIEAANSASYALAQGSPCIDAGKKADEVLHILSDLAGANRIQGTGIDIGAYEFRPTIGAGCNTPSAHNINAFIAENELYVSGVKAGELLNLYDIKGVLLHSQKAGGANEPIVIRLEQRGVYLVSVGANTLKIVY